MTTPDFRLRRPSLRLEALEDRAVPALIGLESADVPVSVTAGVDGGGDLAVRADGTGFVVTYESPDASGGGVFFKRYDANWQLIQGPVAVNTVTTNDQQEPSIGIDSAGNFVIAWQSFGQDPGDSATQGGIYARRFQANGTAIDAAEFRVNTTTLSQQRDPDVSVNASGQYVVAFRTGVSVATILAQSYAGITAGGSGAPTKVGGEAVVKDGSTFPATVPAVGIDAAGNYVVTYQSNGQDGTGFGIYLQRMNQNGTPIGSELQVNTTTTGDQSFPDIALDGSGNFNIVWHSSDIDGSGTAVVMRRFNAAGAALSGEIQVNTGVTSNNQINPHIDATASGTFLVTWTGDEADGDNIGTDVYFKAYNAAGAVVISDRAVSPTTVNNDQGEDNAIGGIDAAGDFVIMFDSGAGANFDTYLRRYAEDADVDFTAASSSAAESSNASIGITRTGAAYVLANVATTVQVTRTGGTATPGTDFTTTFPATVTFPADGSAAQNLTIAVTDDTTNEPDETIALGIGTVTGGTAAGQLTHTYTILDNDPPPTISVNSPSVTEGNSGTTTLTFTVTLSAASANTVTVDYATANGTATTADGDYVAASGTLTFAPGQTSKTVLVTVNGDTKFEANETLSLTLSNPANATIATGTGTGTITNDDTAPTLSIGDATVTETDSGTVNATFTVTLSAASGATTTVNYATANNTAIAGSDYTSASGTLTFAPGETSKTVAVAVTGDALFEGNETFFVNLTGPTNATLADSQGIGTITDNDAAASIAVVSGNNQSTVVSTAFASPLVVEVRNANGTLVQGVSVVFTAPGAGASAVFSTSTNTVTASTGAGGTATTGTVSANGTPGGAYTVTAQATGGTAPSTSFALTNLPATSLSINDVSATEGNSGTKVLTFTVTASPANGVSTTTVDWATANGTATTADGDYVGASGTLTFAPGVTTQTISITINGDVKNEADETFLVNLSNATNAGIADGQGVGTITNDDGVPALSVSDVTLAEGNAGTTAFTFTVTLSAPSGQTVTVNYATADGTALAGSDYTAASGTLTFAPGETTKTVTVLVNGDTTFETTQAFVLNLSAPTNATIADPQGTGTITNDDAAPTLAIGDATASEAAGTVTFTVTRTGATEVPVAVDYGTADGTAVSAPGGPGTPDYTAATGTLNFAPSLAPTATQTFTVTITNDAVYEAAEQFLANLSNASGATIATGTGTGTITNDDAAPTLAIGDATASEAAGTITFTVTLTGATALPVAVNFATADGTAVSAPSGPGTPDYAPTSGTLTFNPSAAGTQTLTITVPLTDDATNEPAEQFVVNLSGPTNGATLADPQGVGTITDDDGVPALSVSDVTLAEGNAGTTAFTFTVTLSAPSGQTVTVNYATADGTALAGSDYTAASGTLTFAPGETTKTVTVLVNGDTTFETTQAFVLNLSAPTNATIADNQGTGTITNDDAAPTLAIGDATASEAAGTVTFTVTRTGATEVPVAVDYATADGTAVSAPGGPGTPDFTAATGTLNFAPSLAPTATQTFTVTIANDAVYEAAEQFLANLSNASGATIADPQGTGTITNDDPAPTLAIGDATASEAAGTITFTVTLTGATALPVAVNYGTADGTAVSAPSGPGTPDYAPTSGTLTFNPSAAGTQTLTITVPLTDDATNEPAEQFVVNLSGPTNGATLADPQGVGTITDDDGVPALSVSDVTLAEGNAGTTAFTFTVTLSAPSGQTVTVNYATADGTALAGSDYAAASGTLTFAPGETTKTVTVLVTGDTTLESDETFVVNLSGPTNATLADPQGTGTITNDDAPPTVTLSLTGSPLAENGGVATVTATLSAPSAFPVTVTLGFTGTASGSDYTASAGSITIPAGSTSGFITLTGVNDAADENAETVIVDATAVSGATEAGTQQVTATIADDDVPTGAADAFATLEDATLTAPSVLGNDNAAPGSTVELVGPTTANGALTLNPDGTFTYAPAANFNGTDAFQYQIRNGANEVSAPVTVSLTVTAVNDAPGFAPPANVTVTEDSGPFSQVGFATGFDAGPPDEDATQAVSAYLVSNSKNALFSAQPSIAPDGTLTFTPAADANGTVTVTVRVRDTGGTANGGDDLSPARTFTITITAVNDPPTFALGADPAVDEDAGPVAVAGFAGGFQPGPATATDEAGQTLSGYTVTVTGTTGGLTFAQAPSIGPDGTLTFTTSPDANGTATVQVTATDSAGATSAPRTFTITVNAVNDPPVNTVPGPQAVPPGDQVVFSAANGTAISVADRDAGSSPIRVTLTATHGTLTVPPAAGVSATGSGTSTVTLQGTVAAINTALEGAAFAPAAGFFGAAQVVVATDDMGATGPVAQTDTDTIVVTVTAPPMAVGGPDAAAAPVVIAVSAPGAPTTVQVRNPTTGATTTIVPYPGFQGEVRVGSGDVNGDGVADVITGAGPGAMGGHVKVFDGVTGTEIASFLAFQGFAGGVFVAAGDLDGDGRDDIIVSADAGAAPHVKVFSGAGGPLLFSFLAYDAGFAGGVRVAAGDVNGDGRDDIVTGSGVGASHVKVFDGRDLSLLASYTAFDGFLGGVYVGAGDLDGDGVAEVATGAGAGASHVKVFDGRTQALRSSFFGFNQAFAGGVRVGTGVVDGVAALLLGSGPAPQPQVIALDPFTGDVLLNMLVGPARPLSSVQVG